MHFGMQEWEGRHRATSVVIGGIGQEVRCQFVRAACNFKFVAYTIGVGVVQACTIAVVAHFRQRTVTIACAFGDAFAAAHATRIELRARTVVLIGVCIIVTRSSIGTARHHGDARRRALTGAVRYRKRCFRYIHSVVAAAFTQWQIRVRAAICRSVDGLPPP